MSGTSEELGMRPRCYPTVRNAPDWHQGHIGLGMCGHGYHTPQGQGPCSGPTSSMQQNKSAVVDRTLDAMVRYTPTLVLTTSLMVRTRDAMVLYTPNLVLTSGLMVRTLNAMVLYTSNVVVTSGLMVRTLDTMDLYTPIMKAKPTRNAGNFTGTIDESF